jgi:predicted DCC family thiol-disulfide oxidoreductase YuxK
MAPVIVFDGDCLFCQRSVRFIHRHDRANAYRFAARQTPTGARLLGDIGVGLAPNSMVLVDDEGVWLRSDAVLRIAGRLGAPWSAARAAGGAAPVTRRRLPPRGPGPSSIDAVAARLRAPGCRAARQDPRLTPPAAGQRARCPTVRQIADFPIFAHSVRVGALPAPCSCAPEFLCS